MIAASPFRNWLPLLTAFLLSTLTSAQLVITEIMYHPASRNPAECYFELHNPSPAPVFLVGASVSKGVNFSIPDSVIESGAFLVIAANLEKFQSIYPNVSNLVGGWTGSLSKRAETIEIRQGNGAILATLSYANEGDWGERFLEEADRRHRGLNWRAGHDGSVSSLENRNLLLPSNFGRNWGSSSSTNGTPGRANSIQTNSVRAVIGQVEHFPAIPTSSETVSIRAEVHSLSEPLEVTLRYRVDGSSNFISTPLSDDGTGIDLAAGDHIYAGLIPPHSNDSVVEFYIQAESAEGIRTWPAPVNVDGQFLQIANALYQVDDRPLPISEQPFYKIIMLEKDRAELEQIGRSSDAESNAQFNATFISIDAKGLVLRYNTGVRNRGHGSRRLQPNNYRISFPNDHPWHDITSLNINGQQTYAQVLGTMLSWKALLPAAAYRAVQVRVNNTNLTERASTDRTYGFYAAGQVVDSDFLEEFMPGDSGGNIYQARRIVRPGADLDYEGEDVEDYQVNYSKNNNQAEDDWSDLINLTKALNRPIDAGYVSAIREVIDLEEWLRYFAVLGFFDNSETALSNGDGDDYLLYRGERDTRFRVLPWDFDTILGLGSSSPTASLFRMDEVEAVDRLIKHPDIVPRYFQIIRELCTGPFAKEPFAATVDQFLGGWVPDTLIKQFNNFATARRANISLRVPDHLSAMADLPLTNGVYYATNEIVTIHGMADPVKTRAVTVNGQTASWVAWRAAWTNSPAALSLGENSFTASAYDTNQSLLESVTFKVYFAPDGNFGGGVVTETTNPVIPPIIITTHPPLPKIIISEVLAQNRSAVPWFGGYPDIIELQNTTTNLLSLEGYGLTDDIARPYRFRFPVGAKLEPGEFGVIMAGKGNNPGYHTGFGLDAEGDEVHLFAPLIQGGELVDSIAFGPQIPDYSIARFGTNWALANPTFEGPNAMAMVDHPRSVSINEWLTEHGNSDDLLELYNTSQLPVSLGEFWLSQIPVTTLKGHQIHPLTFIAPRGYLVFRADENIHSGPTHLSFKLSGHYGMISLAQNDGTLLDLVVYGPQLNNWSEGRAGDGSLRIRKFREPTLGGANPGGPGKDTDGDGMRDDWELQWRMDAQQADLADLDPDGDGVSNLNESLSDTNPRDPASKFTLTIHTDGVGQVLLGIAFPSERAVTLESALGAGWVNLTNFPPASSNTLIQLQLPARSDYELFRLRGVAP